ncbi:MAG: hypothetical protein JO340_06505 [Acidobacteriaceae bacterium]|nr:hypothetical protein [Acidobacteriaceae bacterium]
MRNQTGLFRAALLVLFAVAPRLSFAVDTHIWEQSDESDFNRGAPKHISIRSDGHITLAPAFKELDSTSVPYLWAVAADSKGALYYAGGAPTAATAKIFKLPPNGKPQVFAELTGLEVHSLAVDSQDRIYAAVLPDSKIYRIDNSGKPTLFFDPKCKYVWAMLFDRSGNLYVATGDSGLIYRVSPDGHGAEFFNTGETHARSMILDSKGNLIVGTEPSGLILRISPNGQSFVLYQAAKREVTAVAEHDGVIYASAVGSKPAAVSGPPPVLPATPPSITPSGAPHSGTNPPTLPPAVGSFSASVTGGSDLYRIEKDGFAERIWNSSSDLIYAIAFDASGKPIIGTGNKGVVYRIDSPQLSTELLNTPPTQVTAFLPGPHGVIYAATGNVGNLYSIGPAIEMSGTLESEVLDANDFARWGKAHLTANLRSGAATLETRSGNLNNPENSWSPWSKVPLSPLGGQIASPPARFLQYRLTLACGAKDESPEVSAPEVSAVDIAYLPRNIAPRVNQIEIAPFNYRQAPSAFSLERSAMPSGAPTTLSLPAVGQHKAASVLAPESPSGASTLQYSKGYITVRWNANDPNTDPLLYKVELRRQNDSFWRVLKDKLFDRYYSFDSAAFPDGKYVVRVTASDSPGNTPADALASTLESDPFTIDNTPPEITGVHLDAMGAVSHIHFTTKDALSWIDKAEYSINGGDWTLLDPVNKVTDSQTLEYSLDFPTSQIVAIRVFDENDNVVVKQFGR